jgi:hypothetical protein
MGYRLPQVRGLYQADSFIVKGSGAGSGVRREILPGT